MSEEALLEVRDLAVHFPVTEGVFGRRTGSVKAVDGVSFDIRHGGTLGLVGESGCGKSTVGRAILRLLDPTAGSVRFDGRDITELPQSELRELRRQIQIVFQDPFASLNPRMTVMDIVGESLGVHGVATGAELEARVVELLSRVGIPRAWVNRYPHEFSGGQRQRISIARAIALGPKLVVCDEAVSALDVSIQAQVINLLIELRREMDLAYLFISHDLAVVRHISDEVAVMYLGQIVERAPTAQLFATPAHPYTRALLSAIPVPDPSAHSRRIPLSGDVPTPLHPPSGCRFHTRCPAVMDRCRVQQPAAIDLPGGQQVSCFLAEGLSGRSDWHAEVLARSGVDDGPPLAATPAPDAARVAAERLSHLAHAASLKDEERPFRLSLAALLAAAGLLCLMLATVVHQSRAQRVRAEAQLGELSQAIEAVAETTGKYPESLRGLGWRLPAIVGGGDALDPWGQPWRYQVPGESGASFDLGSSGPDRQPGGGDDIGRLGRSQS